MQNDEEKLNIENKDINNSSNLDEPKKVIKNIFIVVFGNICTILAGVLVGFLIPKIMQNGDSTIDYGFYKIYTLYFGYIGLFHFGFCDGILLMFAGKKYEDLEKEKIRCYTKFFIIFQFIISLFILIPSIFYINTEYGFIFLFIGINLFSGNITEYYQQICQATGRFKELSLRNIIKALLNSIIIMVLFILWKISVIDYLKFQIYIYCVTFVGWAITIWYIFNHRDITFGKSIKIKDALPMIKKFYIIGIPLLISNFVSNFILNIDRQFVSILFPTETYATYAFAYNMLQLITTATGAISLVLFPTLKRFSEDKLKNHYNYFISIVIMFVGLCLISYFPLYVIVIHWLEGYSSSLPIFQIILPGLILSSTINMIMFNYYKALGKSTIYFINSLIILLLSIAADFVAYFVFKTTLSISIASVIVMVLWYFITDIYLVKKWKINTIKNFIYIALIITSFLLSTYLISNIYLSGVIYLICYIIISFIFYFKLIKNKFKFSE